VAHRNARTTVYARQLIVERHRAGWPAVRIAEQLGFPASPCTSGSAATARKARPWTNGKADWFNRTLLAEFAYAQPWLSNTDRLAALPDWLTHYDTRRAHSALGGRPPITRLAA